MGVEREEAYKRGRRRSRVEGGGVCVWEGGGGGRRVFKMAGERKEVVLATLIL